MSSRRRYRYFYMLQHHELSCVGLMADGYLYFML